MSQRGISTAIVMLVMTGALVVGSMFLSVLVFWLGHRAFHWFDGPDCSCHDLPTPPANVRVE